MIIRSLALALVLGLLGVSPAIAAPISEAEANAIVDAADRDKADRERDARRKPVELLVFSQVSTGARVADIGAGGGYTTELLARAVGAQGTVYGHNEPAVIEKYVSESWPARLSKPVNAKVIRADRAFGDPLPEDATDLDLIVIVYFYHDAPLYKVDRAALNAKFFAALKPGGKLVVVDHHAKAGAPVDETADTLHRMDEAVVKADLEAAGFTLDASGDFMRQPDDPRDAPFFKMDTPTDSFVHRWVKPEAAAAN